MQIDFYILAEQSHQQDLVSICHLLEKCYQENKSTYVLCSDIEQQQELDKTLWSFNDTSFIPHGTDGKSAITLGTTLPKSANDIFMDLSLQKIDSSHVGDKLLQIVPEAQKVKGRELYKAYREGGCEIKTFTY